MTSREASHAGSWYSKDGKTLSAQLDGWLTQALESEFEGGVDPDTLPDPNVRAVIAPCDEESDGNWTEGGKGLGGEAKLPLKFHLALLTNTFVHSLNFHGYRHAGFSYSGPTAAFAYASVDASEVERVFILGPSHHVYLDGCALSRCDEYKTPMGNLAIDSEIVNELKKTGHFRDMNIQTDEDEHSIEMHLPYVWKLMERKGTPFKIIPILVGSIKPDAEKLYGRILSKYLTSRKNLFIISSDFCHWGSRFDHTPVRTKNVPIHASIELTDREGMQIIERMKPKEFTDYLKATKNTICGRHPIGVLLNAVEAVRSGVNNGLKDGENVKIKFVRYAQSSKVVNERDSSVSYASAVCFVGK
ncbi:hypothetical protein HDU76_013845 [Blyttiomyces sp. JEL0837]|nr:hypothetical protein HDU76_013845 [Blyttiomyces sp. JEL0837]